MAEEKSDHDRIVEMHAVLLGCNGDDGLVGDFKRVSKELFHLKRNFWLLVGLLVGGGVLTGSAIAAFGG